MNSWGVQQDKLPKSKRKPRRPIPCKPQANVSPMKSWREGNWVRKTKNDTSHYLFQTRGQQKKQGGRTGAIRSRKTFKTKRGKAVGLAISGYTEIERVRERIP